MLPAKTVLAMVALLCAGLFFAAARRRDPLLPASLGLWCVRAPIGGVYPAAVEHSSVEPHELAREPPTRTSNWPAPAALRAQPGPGRRYPLLTARSPAPELRLGPPGRR